MNELTLKSVSKFPRTINLELTNNCNLKCQMCLNWVKTFRKKGNMNKILLKKIIGELIKNKKYINSPINLCGIGSPLLYKDIFFAIDQLYSAGIDVVISTNGILLDKKISLKLLKKCKKIMISLDSFSRESYYKIKGRDFFDLVLKNISTLLYLKKIYKLNTSIQINMLNINSTYNEIINCLDYFGPFLSDGDSVYTRNVKDLGFLSKKNNTNDNLFDLKNALEDNKYYDKIIIENWKEWLSLGDNFERFPCRHLWFYCMILYNGDVTVCCMDFNGTLKLGNVNHNSIKEIWNGKIYNKFRNDIINNDFRNKELCVNCEDWYKCW